MVEVVLEFTDAQWALILEHYGLRFNGESGEWIGIHEVSDFITEIKRHVQQEIERGIVDKARIDAKGAFDV